MVPIPLGRIQISIENAQLLNYLKRLEAVGIVSIKEIPTSGLNAFMSKPIEVRLMPKIVGTSLGKFPKDSSAAKLGITGEILGLPGSSGQLDEIIRFERVEL